MRANGERQDGEPGRATLPLEDPARPARVEEARVPPVAESRRLADCEAVIERGLATFIEVGKALMQIREARLYRERWSTFEDYCRERWEIGRTYAHRVIQASEVVAMLPNGNTPTSEAQARELAPLRDEPEQLKGAWAKARQRAADEQRPVTARDVRKAVDQQRSDRIGHGLAHLMPGDPATAREHLDAWEAQKAREARERFPRPGFENTTVRQVRAAARWGKRLLDEAVRLGDRGIGDWSCAQGLHSAARQYRDAADALTELAKVLERRAWD